jgi:xanthine dehydrogenase YagT iron-sulfur-binding subunit
MAEPEAGLKAAGSDAASAAVASKDARGNGGVSRRSFIQTLGLSAAAGALGAQTEKALAAQDAARDSNADLRSFGPNPAPVTLNINGQRMEASLDPSTTLMEALRWSLNLTGTKEVCDRGACGACSVHVDGRLVASCMMLAVDAVGSEITTIEGLGQPGKLDPLQQAFIKHDALQCGYCTPGLVMACKALLNEHAKPSLAQIKHGLSGNICRCGTYTNIFNAVLEASGQPVPADGKGDS